MTPPYVSDPETGKSKTRQFVESFFEAYCGATDDRPYSLYDKIFFPTVGEQQALYKESKRDSTRRYIGRASHMTAGTNSDELLWCVLADISTACRKLDDKTRVVLGMRYVQDCHPITIGETMGLSEYEVERIIDAGINSVVKILDNQ